MTARTALKLRLLGPLIEVVCLAILYRVRDQEQQIGGIPVEYPLYAGLAIGFALVTVGVVFSRPSGTRTRDPD